MGLLLVCLLCFAACEGHDIVFDFVDYDPGNETTHVQKVYADFEEKSAKIGVINVPSGVGFLVIQIHSWVTNVTLSADDGSSITGTNIGLVALTTSSLNFNAKSKKNNKILVAVVAHQSEDPIPGGCNLTFDTKNAPYQLVSFDDNLITVQSQPPSAIFTNCDNNNIQMDMYHMYLHELRFDRDSYFEGLENMLTVSSIKTNGRKVRTTRGYFKYHKLYSSYRGVGRVFAIIATYRNRSAAYVPAVSYGCDLSNADVDCYCPVTWSWKLLCALMLILGLFVCCFGHRFFRFTLYIKGCTVGIFLVYFMLGFKEHLTATDKAIASLIIGLAFGTVWLLIWWKFGIPILSVALSFSLTGFLVASVIFYAGLGDLDVFHNDIAYTFTFLSFIVVICVVCAIFTWKGHIMGCSLVGAYACVAALNLYTGGNLQYIVINSFRRVGVANFNQATIDPPFHVLDIAGSSLLVVMVVFGFYYQLKVNRDRPPFPPHHCRTIQDGVSERTPLMSGSGVIFSDI